MRDLLQGYGTPGYYGQAGYWGYPQQGYYSMPPVGYMPGYTPQNYGYGDYRLVLDNMQAEITNFYFTQLYQNIRMFGCM